MEKLFLTFCRLCVIFFCAGTFSSPLNAQSIDGNSLLESCNAPPEQGLEVALDTY